ncbi:HECT-domain (ubiquitin-transferase) domain-containing protein [Babesia ovis]|uniref:HECT-type E3 ubiquitin transferase n=1 Tax=Babesia ovis TaxID=5869 RepID=A0A9W5TC05_BABOV|nr:HECT-domain (ubiquitin-transferase) domain-containing protein [Babesia ovis]
MFFDGSIGPKRVVSLSGSTGFGRARTFQRQQPGFLSVKHEQDRAATKIVRFLKRVVERRRYLQELNLILPKLLAEAEKISYETLDDLEKRRSQIYRVLKCGRTEVESNDNVNESHMPGSYFMPNRLRYGKYPNTVTIHPLCRLMRVVGALAIYDWKTDYSHYVRQTLILFNTWYYSSQGEDVLTKEVLSNSFLKKQLVHLCLKFLRVLLGKTSDNWEPSYSGHNVHQDSGMNVGSSNVIQTTASLSAVHLGTSVASDGNTSATSLQPPWLRANTVNGSNGKLLSSVVDSRQRDNLKLSGKRLCLDVALLTEDETEKIFFVAAMFRILPLETIHEVNDQLKISTHWFPNMMRRAMALREDDSLTVYALFEISQVVRQLCKTKQEAFKLVVDVWSMPMQVPGDNLELLRGVVNATIYTDFVRGFCCVGCKPRDTELTNVVEYDQIVSTEHKDAIFNKLKKSVRSSLPMTISLNNSLWQMVESNIQSQVDAILAAPEFVNITSNVVLVGGSGALDEYLPSKETGFSYLRYGASKSREIAYPVVLSGCFAYERIFDNMMSLLRTMITLQVGEMDKEWVTSIVSMLLLCSQFYSVEKRNNIYMENEMNLHALFHILRVYREDEYIVLVTTMLLVPIIEWQYFTSDLEATLMANASAATKSKTDLDENMAKPKLSENIGIELVANKVPVVLLNLFRRHYKNCCGNTYPQFAARMSETLSNDSTMCYLWNAFSMILDYCLVAMDDAALVGDEDTEGMFNREDAVFIANCLNYTFLYHVQPSNDTEKWKTTAVNDNFPWNAICSCGIEIKTNEKFHISNGHHGFNSVYWGEIARRFGRRFFRQDNGSPRSDIIIEVERAVLRHMKANQLDAPIMKSIEYIPQAVSFDTRLKLFMAYVANDKAQHRSDMPDDFDMPPYIIRRSHIVEDALFTLGNLGGTQLKQQFRVIFMDETGVREEGIDGGGLFKEFLTQICSIIFNPAYGIFEESPYDRSFAPSPNSAMVNDQHLTIFTFVGKVVGKAMYEHILVEHVLSKLLLNFMLRQRNTIDDLKQYDPEMYRNLVSLRQMSAEDIESLGLNFTTAISSFGDAVQAEIVKGGSNMKVTKDNCDHFIYQFADFKCNRLIEPQSVAFLRGFSQLIQLDWLQLFSPSELVYLISGSDAMVDIKDMFLNSTYSGGYDNNSNVIVWFWEVMNEFDEEQRRKFLWFVTCCKRAPLLGFKQLHPPFCITRDPNAHNLPTVSTCTNLLKLPEYGSKSELRAKLIDAMTMSKGFGLG